MARTHGRDGDFGFDDATGLESEINSVTLNMSVPAAGITSFADAWRNATPGKPTATIDIAGYGNMAASQGDITIFGELGQDAEEWDYEPDGTTGYDGFAIVTSYSITSAADAAISYSASFRHNGGSAEGDGGAPTRG